MINKIFLGSLPGNSDEQELLDLFSLYGQVSKVKLKKRKRGVCTGHGYLICQSDETFRNILSCSSQYVYKGREIDVMPFLYKDSLKSHQETFNRKRISVSNIPLEATSEDLEELFEQMGEVHKAFIIENKELLVHKKKKSKRKRKGKWSKKKKPTQRGFVIFKDERTSDWVVKEKIFLFGVELKLEFYVKNSTEEQAGQDNEDNQEYGQENSANRYLDNGPPPLDKAVSSNRNEIGNAQQRHAPGSNEFGSRSVIPNLDFAYRDKIKIINQILDIKAKRLIDCRHLNLSNTRFNWDTGTLNKEAEQRNF